MYKVFGRVLGHRDPRGGIIVFSFFPRLSRSERSARGLAHRQVRRCDSYIVNGGGTRRIYIGFTPSVPPQNVGFDLRVSRNELALCSITHQAPPPLMATPRMTEAQMKENRIVRTDAVLAGLEVVAQNGVWYIAPE